jgi:hypothetical protein
MRDRMSNRGVSQIKCLRKVLSERDRYGGGQRGRDGRLGPERRAAAQRFTVLSERDRYGALCVFGRGSDGVID